MPATDDKHFDKDHREDGSGMAPRSCTDIMCLLVFIGFMGGMSYVAQYGLKNGNPRRLTHGFNYGGNLCGVDPGFETMGLLYYCPTMGVGGVPTGLNLKAPVCVSACPTDDTLMINCLSQSSASAVPTAAGQAVTLTQSLVATQSYATTEMMGLYCIPDLAKLKAIADASGVPVPAGLRDSLFNEDGPIGKSSVKVQAAVGSLRRAWPLLVGSMILATLMGYAYLFLLKMCARPLIYLVLMTMVLLTFSIAGFFYIGELMPRPDPIAGGNTVAPPLLLNATAVANAAPTVATVVTAAPTGAPIAVAAPTPAPIAATAAPAAAAPAPTPAPDLSAGGTGGYRRLAVPTSRRLMTYAEACQHAPASCVEMQKRWDEFGGRKKWEELNPYYNEHMALADAKKASFITACVFAGLGLLFLLVICCAGRAINTALGCIEAACECIFAMPCMLIMPAVEVVVKAILFAVLMGLFSFLVSSGTLDTKTYAKIGVPPYQQEVNGLRRKFEYTDEQKGYIAYFVFGIFWVLELCNAMGAFVTSYAVVGWYYTPKTASGYKGHNWTGLIVGYIYACTCHLGTLALGSFLIALLRYIRLIMMVIEQQAKEQHNAAAQCIAKCLICCITCFKKFLEYMNKNAYIDVCITSNNFCGAASDVMQFLAGHPAEITILNGACTIFAFGGMSLISGVTGYTTYMLCTSQPRWTDDTSPHYVASPFAIAIFATLGAAFIAHAFMMVFDHTADTLLYTYCYNKSKAHNTVQNYAPDSLCKLTGYAPIKKPATSSGSSTPKAEQPGFWGSLFGSHTDNGSSAEKQPLVGH